MNKENKNSEIYHDCQKDHNELIQELTRVNNKLVASENLKTNFLSNIRNEINNPLAAVLELSKSISNGNLTIEQTKKFADIIHSEAFNLDFQLRNIFLSAEAESGDLSLSVATIDVVKIIQNVIESFQHLINKKNLVIITFNNIKKSDNLFSTDAEKLHLILSNLIANAIQFSEDNQSIGIVIDIFDNQLKVSVKDYGLGIDKEKEEIIFDRFRQGQEGSTKNYSGHGLGLSISQTLLEIINGELIIESVPDKGSMFTIIINEAINGNEGEMVFSDNGNDFMFTDSNSMIF